MHTSQSRSHINAAGMRRDSTVLAAPISRQLPSNTAFANTTMLQRLSALISNGTANGGNAPLIGEWGLAGAHFVSQRMHAHDKAANMRNIPLHGSLAWHCSMKRAAESILLR